MAVYLDFNASTPVDPRVLDRMVEVYRSHFGNADSRTHVFGTQAKELVNGGRSGIAEILNVDPTDVFFTSGSTESNILSPPPSSTSRCWGPCDIWRGTGARWITSPPTPPAVSGLSRFSVSSGKTPFLSP